MEVADIMQPKTIKIIMLGDSLCKQGGIVTVQKLILEQVPPNIQIEHIASAGDGSGIQKIVFFGIALCKLVLKLLSTEVDILHIHVAERASTFRKSIVTLIVLIWRKPVILHAHGPEFRLFYSKLPQFLKEWISWVFRRSDRFIVLSESWKNYYINDVGLKPEQVVVLPNPAKLPAQVPHRPNSDIVNFVFLGRIGQRKGSFDLIEAYANLPAEYKNRARLILAGDGDVMQAQSLITTLNLSNYITVSSWLDSEQRDALLAKADVFVLPSYNEGLPMSILEAMSWGLPIITTPVGGIPELVTHSKNGLLVNPGDIQQLSEAMKSLIENDKLRLSLGSNARVTVIPYDVKNYFSSLVCIYHSLLGFKQPSYVETAK